MNNRVARQPLFISVPGAAIAVALVAYPCHAVSESLADLALGDLLQVDVSSVSRFSQPTTEAPAAVTVIDEEELRHHGYRNLAEALVTAPGIYTSGDRNYTFLGVRGFNRPGDYGTRLLLLTDGTRRNDPLYDQALLGNESPIEIDWVKRLEFVSGPASSIYGANALFGTANAVMLEGSDINGARVSLDAGSNDTRRFGLVAGQRLEGDRDWFVGFAAYKSKGEDLYFPEFNNGTTNGHAHGLDGESYQKAYTKFRWGNWRLTGNFSWRDKNDPTGNFGTTFGKRGSNLTDESRLFELRYEGDVNNDWQSSFRVYHGGYRFTENYNYSPSPNSRDRAQADWSGGEFRSTYTGFAQHKLLFGIDSQWNWRVSQQYYEVAPFNLIHDSNHPSRTIAAYAQDEWRFHPDWLLNMSLRHDKHNQFSGVTSPRTALIWQTTPRITLKVISGSAYRTPNVYERFYNDNGASQVANPNLKPEHIRTNELSATYRFGTTGRIGISAYSNRIRDLIDRTQTSTGVYTHTNLDQVKARGIELDAENRWTNGLRLRGSLSWQRTQGKDGTTFIDSPIRMGKLIASLPIAYGWTTSGEFIAVSARHGDNGPVPGYGVANLSLISAPDTRYGQFSLSIYNLGNRRYYAPASITLTQQAIEQASRQIRLRWTLAL